MPDAHVLLSSFRDEIGTLDRRRAELRGQLEALDQEHDRLATTISVLEDRVGAAPQPGPADAPEAVSLADRIVDALGTSGLRRTDMLRIFTAQGFTPSAIDSATNRLKKRGTVRRQGRRIVHVVPPSGLAEPVAPDSGGVGGAESGAGPMSDPETVDRGLDEPPADGGVPGLASTGAVSGERVADADNRPVTQRVRDAVQGGVDTSKELKKYFGLRGVKRSSVNGAIWGLRKRGVLNRLPDGKLVVTGVGE